VSAHIGEVRKGATLIFCRVFASTEGVEVDGEHYYVLTPCDARNLAALLVRGADEVERMRHPRGAP
jgi:hypothetical protein